MTKLVFRAKNTWRTPTTKTGTMQITRRVTPGFAKRLTTMMIRTVEKGSIPPSTASEPTTAIPARIGIKHKIEISHLIRIVNALSDDA